MTRLLVTAALAVAAIPAPASAEPGPDIRLTYQHYSVPLDAGHLVVVTCDASAVPGAPQQIPVATEVLCSIGTTTERMAMPGGEAVAVVTAPVLGSAVVCVSGEAVFVDPVNGQILTAARGPSCTTVTP